MMFIGTYKAVEVVGKLFTKNKPAIENTESSDPENESVK